MQAGSRWSGGQSAGGGPKHLDLQVEVGRERHLRLEHAAILAHEVAVHRGHRVAGLAVLQHGLRPVTSRRSALCATIPACCTRYHDMMLHAPPLHDAAKALRKCLRFAERTYPCRTGCLQTCDAWVPREQLVHDDQLVSMMLWCKGRAAGGGAPR